MKRLAFTFAAFALLAGCMYPHIPTNLPTNGGATVELSNLTLSTVWGSQKIEWFKMRSVENQNSNIAPIPLRRVPGTDVYEEVPR